jgi:hypothetical protein
MSNLQTHTAAARAEFLGRLPAEVRSPIEEIVFALRDGNSTTFLNALGETHIEKFYFLVPDGIIQLRRVPFFTDSPGGSGAPVDICFYDLGGNCVHQDWKRHESPAVFLMAYPSETGRAELIPLKGKPSFIRMVKAVHYNNIAPAGWRL